MKPKTLSVGNNLITDVKSKVLKTVRLSNSTVSNMVQTHNRHLIIQKQILIVHVGTPAMERYIGSGLLERDIIHLLVILQQVPARILVSGPILTVGEEKECLLFPCIHCSNTEFYWPFQPVLRAVKLLQDAQGPIKPSGGPVDRFTANLTYGLQEPHCCFLERRI